MKKEVVAMLLAFAQAPGIPAEILQVPCCMACAWSQRWLPTDSRPQRAPAETTRPGVMTRVPGSGFGAPGHVRIAYCVQTERIERALPKFKASGLGGRKDRTERRERRSLPL